RKMVADAAEQRDFPAPAEQLSERNGEHAANDRYVEPFTDVQPLGAAAAHVVRVDVSDTLIPKLDGPAVAQPIAAEHLPRDRGIVVAHPRIAAFVVGRADGYTGINPALDLLRSGRQGADAED